jgi:hypothetical protein
VDAVHLVERSGQLRLLTGRVGARRQHHLHCEPVTASCHLTVFLRLNRRGNQQEDKHSPQSCMRAGNYRDADPGRAAVVSLEAPERAHGGFHPPFTPPPPPPPSGGAGTTDPHVPVATCSQSAWHKHDERRTSGATRWL